jgi:hypothetical protein
MLWLAGLGLLQALVSVVVCVLVILMAGAAALLLCLALLIGLIGRK